MRGARDDPEAHSHFLISSTLRRQEANSPIMWDPEVARDSQITGQWREARRFYAFGHG